MQFKVVKNEAGLNRLVMTQQIFQLYIMKDYRRLKADVSLNNLPKLGANSEEINSNNLKKHKKGLAINPCNT